MSLPSPNFAFTVPSVHDDTILSCRLYVPRKQLLVGSTHALKAAIVAHPYAPLGGCYDDPIVDNVGGVLLKAGYAICTFNFRYDSLCNSFVVPLMGIKSMKGLLSPEARLDLQAVHRGRQSLSLEIMYPSMDS